MVRPGISRAVPMGILGFLTGALLVTVVRALQGMEPVWDAGVAIVFGAFFSAGFFVWGIGGFDPRLSAHGDEAHHAEEEESIDTAPPPAILTHTMWQISFAVLLLMLALAAMAALGPTLITTADSDAAVNQIGMVPVVIGNTEIIVSQLVLFVAFVGFMLISLTIAAGLIGWLITYLSRGGIESRAGEAAALPATTEPAEAGSPRRLALFVVSFVVLFAVLYLLFYYVLIGMVMPNPPGGLPLVSAVNALVFTVLILRPRWVVMVISRVAGWLANLLRSRSKPYEGVRKIQRGKRP